MYFNLSDEQIRSVCRTNLEALEKWARLLIHQVLTAQYGQDYIHLKFPDGNYRFKKELVEKADKMKAREPSRFPTHLDTLYIDELIYLLTHPLVYNQIARYITQPDYYPQGQDELKTYLNRLIPIRNKLSHSNPFPIRDAQRAICYSNDFIDFVKYYFRQQGMSRDFNVPSILKVSDSLGNETIVTNNPRFVNHKLIEISSKSPLTLHKGEQFSISIEMDPSFPETDYRIEWHKTEGMEILENGKKIVVTIGNKLIGEEVVIACKIISNNEWHRFGQYDQMLLVTFKAIPMPSF